MASMTWCRTCNEGYYSNDDASYKKLWHGCAGPLAFLPLTREQVYYFPQGHIEQLGFHPNEQLLPQFNLPSHILCRVINTQSLVEPETDEVYAQIALLPESDQANFTTSPDFQLPGHVHTFHSFCRTVTASDLSNFGGLIISSEDAETLPPLDISEHVATQEFVATDLSGNEWNFTHSFQGNPNRHVLTTGWSEFVRSKKIVPGDSLIFVRGESKRLRVGVRKVKQLKTQTTLSVVTHENMYMRVLAAASHAVITGSLFTVFYKPRTCQSPFIIEVNKYLDAQNYRFSVGMRFMMRFEGNQDPEVSFQGTIVGIEDISSRWSHSDWRCLKVCWDEPSPILRPERVSPWELSVFPTAVPDDGMWVFPAETSFLTYNDDVCSSSSSYTTSDDNLISHSEGSSSDSGSVNKRENSIESIASVFDECSTPSSDSSSVNIAEASSISQCEIPTCCCRLEDDAQSRRIRRRTEVQMKGVAVGRFVDMTRFTCHKDLLRELELKFGIEGELNGSSKKWTMIYSDVAGETKMVEDYPWQEFCRMVKKIFIKTVG